MKANDLMIGDWVCTEHDSTPRQIDWIRTGEVGLFWNKVVTPPYLVPIPITLEILEKNGFTVEWDEDVKLMVSGMIRIEIGNNYKRFSDGKMYFRGVLAPIYYVHQLQHAIRLCGIEKEIEL